MYTRPLEGVGKVNNKHVYDSIRDNDLHYIVHTTVAPLGIFSADIYC